MSNNDVTLNNIKKIGAMSSINWITGNNSGITVSGVEIDNTNTAIRNIVQGNLVTFKNYVE